MPRGLVQERLEGVLDQVTVATEDHIQEVVVLDVLDPEYTLFLC